MKGMSTASRQPGNPAEVFYVEIMQALTRSAIPFMVGGGYAMARLAGIARRSKDLDLFCPEDAVKPIIEALEARGVATELTSPHWLAKAFRGEHFVDFVFNSPNGRCPVRQEWLNRAYRARVLGEPVLVMAPEEMIFCKLYLQKRFRYDGPDVHHLLLTQGPRLDWDHLVSLVGGDYPLLLAQIINFNFVFPGQRAAVPARIFRTLVERLERDLEDTPSGGCRGLLLDEDHYLEDVTVRPFTNSAPERLIDRGRRLRAEREARSA